MIRFGTNPIAWANDDDQTLGAHIPTDQILRDAAEIGFDGMENGHRWPQNDPEALRALFAQYGLVYVSGWTSLNLLVRSVEEVKAEIQPALEKLKHNGSKVCIAAETSNSIQGLSVPLSDKPVLGAETMKSFGAKVEEVAEHTAAQGIELVYHPHVGTVVETPEEIDAFMDATGPATRLLFDTGHCYFGGNGCDPAEVLRRHAHRLSHFHAKNVRANVMNDVRANGRTFMDGVRAGVFTVPGDPAGAIDFEPCLQILKEQNYDGWIVIEAEQDAEQFEPFEYQNMGLQTLKRIARQIGLIEEAQNA